MDELQLISYIFQYLRIYDSKMNLISTLVLSKKRNKQIEQTQIKQCEDVDRLLQHILDDNNVKLKQVYSYLETVINILSTKRGPKSFRNLLDQIFNFTKIYSYDRIKAYDQQIVILNLTYYQKLFKQTLSTKQKLQLTTILAIANIHIFLRTNDFRRLNCVDDKIQEALAINIEDKNLSSVFSLLNGIYVFLKGQNKKAKSIFANLLTKIVSQKKQILKCEESLQIMAITSFYCYLNLSKMSQHELASYYLSKSYEYGKKIGQPAACFLQKLKQMGIDRPPRNIKLTRIQNKLQILNRKIKTSWNLKTMKPKIYNNKNQYDQKIIDQQLRNIFTIKDTKATMYKFRKDNMKYLQGQQIKLNYNIYTKQQELKQISKLQKILDKHDQINDMEHDIKILASKKRQLSQQYFGLKQKHLHQLKPIKIINNYMRTYFDIIEYEKMSYVYNFLHGQMLSRAKVFILSIFMRRRIKKVKRSIMKVKVNFKGILHLLEIFQIIQNKNVQLLIYKKKQLGYYVKIYPLQHQKDDQFQGIQDQKKIQKTVFQHLLRVPFYYQFDINKNKLVSWNQYLNKKSLLVIYYVRKFIQKLNKRCKDKQQRQQFQKIRLSLKFSQYTTIQTTLFACITRVCQDNSFLSVQPRKVNHSAFIFTIGLQKYHNKLYNLKINKNIILQNSRISDQIAVNLVQSQFLRSISTRINQIKRIQKFIRFSYCKKKVNQLKSKCKVAVYVQGYDVYTCCKNTYQRSYISVQNIVTKDREVVDTIMDFDLFKQIHIIKDKLAKQRTCKDKIKLTFKFMWTKYFVSRLKSNYKGATIITDFQVNFRNRIIFSKIFNNYLYKKKHIMQKIVFSFTVQNLVDFPRPYTLRIFTIHNGNNIVDICHCLYNKQKLFYQKNINKLNEIVNILSKRQMEIVNENEYLENLNKRYGRRSICSRASRTSLLSRYCTPKSNSNFNSEDQIKQQQIHKEVPPKFLSKKSSMLIRLKNRKSLELTKNESITIVSQDKINSKNPINVNLRDSVYKNQKLKNSSESESSVSKQQIRKEQSIKEQSKRYLPDLQNQQINQT